MSKRQDNLAVRQFSARLNHAAKVGELTPSDLARWFERPYSTMRTWIEGDRMPREGSRGKIMMKRLSLLESAIKSGFLPLPVSLSEHARPQRIIEIRHGLERTGVPEGNPSRARA
jgi:hypothetical protein